MNKLYLQMKYHPAKKEVEFHRFENGKEITISGGKLQRYMNKKGQFVIQDHGNEFFTDIARAFDGIKALDMQVITTRIDYEDLVQMIEYYNASLEVECKITPTLIAELPDMKTTYNEIAKYGEEAIAVLQSHRNKLFDINKISNEYVKKSAENFAAQIDEESKNIREKIDSICDNRVSLCFTGVYSAGKSALINALLGYKILPEKITSKTAKMFQISSPKAGDPIKIIFDIDNVKAILQWETQKNCFEFIQGPSEDDERARIQIKINQLKDDGKVMHDQISMLLTELNGMDSVLHDIRIEFPIPLDNDVVQFTIYDTPGTDSNYSEHQEVLMDALSEQTQSILIFVAAPNKTEGTGNNALLKYLKETEAKGSKTGIDLGRSLFVINWSDSIDSDERKDLQCEEIKYRNEEDEKVNFSIKLSNKKLFFTSAKMAYSAKAKKNGIASPKDESVFNRGLDLMQDEYAGYCYRENRCATSEFATERMHSQCEEVLDCARKDSDDVAILEICSGIYALEREIIQYGEKYSSAVKAFAIIDSVNKALTKLSNRSNSLMESNKEDIQRIQHNIDELRATINGAIEEEYNNKAIPENTPLPEETLKKLKLDSKTLNYKIVGNIQYYMDKELKKNYFGLGKVEFKKSDKVKIRDKCNQVIKQYTDDFLKNRKIILEAERDDFIAKVKNKIMDNGEISDAAKKFFLDVPAPKLPNWKEVRDLGEIYNNNKYTGGIVIKKDYLHKETFMRQVKEILLKSVEEMGENYRKDYRDSLETILLQIKTSFATNLESYSLNMKALMENKDSMMELGNRVSHAAKVLRKCEEELNAIIWKEVK